MGSLSCFARSIYLDRRSLPSLKTRLTGRRNKVFLGCFFFSLFLVERGERMCYTCGVKKCCKCKSWGNEEEFYKNRATRDGLSYECRTCRKAYRKREKPRTPEMARRHQLKHKYGITPEEWDAILESQDGRCYLCREEFGEALPNVDHCHATGVVRGLAHSRCNRGIGVFGDDPVRMAKVARRLWEAMSDERREFFSDPFRN